MFYKKNRVSRADGSITVMQRLILITRARGDLSTGSALKRKTVKTFPVQRKSDDHRLVYIVYKEPTCIMSS